MRIDSLVVHDAVRCHLCQLLQLEGVGHEATVVTSMFCLSVPWTAGLLEPSLALVALLQFVNRHLKIIDAINIKRLCACSRPRSR